MSTLHINISLETVPEFGGGTVEVKNLTSTIDDLQTNINTVVDSAVSDNDAKISHKSDLTSKGFTWDEEV